VPIAWVQKLVCSWCGKTIREGETPVSHGICVACAEKHYPEGKDPRPIERKDD
jgi:hypothetical protein